MTPATHAIFDKIVLGGLLQPAGMPRWDDVLSEGDAQAIHAYLIAEANSAYQDQQHATSGNPATDAGGRIY
jgi:quinohemoprotein ethanol dehydrogenase